MSTRVVARLLVDLGILERHNPGVDHLLDEEARRVRHAQSQQQYRARLKERKVTGDSTVLKRGRPKKYTTEEEVRAARQQYQAAYQKRHKDRVKQAVEQLVQAAAPSLLKPTGIDSWCMPDGRHSAEASTSILQMGLGISHSS